MKVLLTAINAKYIHSNLAVYSLRAYAGKYAQQTEIAEYTIDLKGTVTFIKNICDHLYPASPSGIVCSESVYLYFSGTNERNPDSGSSGHPDLFYRIFVSGHQHGLYLLFSVRGKIRPVPFTLPVKRMYSGGGICLYSSGILWKHRNLAGISCR